MKDAKALLPEGRDIFDRLDLVDYRFLVDVTGEFYTLVLEITYEELAHFEDAAEEISGDPDWGDWYGRFTELVREGDREIFRVLEE